MKENQWNFIISTCFFFFTEPKKHDLKKLLMRYLILFFIIPPTSMFKFDERWGRFWNRLHSTHWQFRCQNIHKHYRTFFLNIDRRKFMPAVFQSIIFVNKELKPCRVNQKETFFASLLLFMISMSLAITICAVKKNFEWPTIKKRATVSTIAEWCKATEKLFDSQKGGARAGVDEPSRDMKLRINNVV